MPPDPAATGASEIVAAYLAAALEDCGRIGPGQRAMAEEMLRRGFLEGVQWLLAFQGEQ